MREVLFRGKRLDNGKWVFGYYGVHHIPKKDNHDKLMGYNEVHAIFNDSEGERTKGGFWKTVDPATVGQYTGFTDKDGNKIFEGDVLKWNCSMQPVVVYWHDRWGCWMVKNDHTDLELYKIHNEVSTTGTTIHDKKGGKQ